MSETFSPHVPVTNMFQALQWVRPLVKPKGQVKQRWVDEMEAHGLR